MKVIPAARRHQLYLRSTITEFGAGILRDDGELTSIVNVGPIRNEVYGVRADEIVLHVDAVTSDVGERRSLSINTGRVVAVRRGARLQEHERKRIAAI